MKTLSMREQLDCLIVALEANLESMRGYMKICGNSMVGEASNPVYIHSHGMRAGAAYCAEMTEKTLEAAKKQRARWGNE